MRAMRAPWRIGLLYSALVRLEFRAREGKPPMTNDSDRDRGQAVECGVGAEEAGVALGA
jgi:hypothetical protein